MDSTNRSKSIFRMANIESFPEEELLWLMHLFNHADGNAGCKPHTARVEDRNCKYLDSFDKSQGQQATIGFEYCWLDDLNMFLDARSQCERILQSTYYEVTLSVVHRTDGGGGTRVARVLSDSVWSDQPLMLRRVVHALFTARSSADVRTWIAICEAVKQQIASLPSLKRLAVQVVGGLSNDGASEEMARFLSFSLEDCRAARKLVIEVHRSIGPARPMDGSFK